MSHRGVTRSRRGAPALDALQLRLHVELSTILQTPQQQWRLSDDSDRAKFENEPFVGRTKVWVFYSSVPKGTATLSTVIQLRRCETPLVSPQLIDGSKATLKDDPLNATRKKATVLSKDLDITLGLGNGSADDPRTAGATVRIVSTAGDTFDNVYNLAPGAFWSLVGGEGENRGYRYRDSLLVNGP